MNFPHILSRLSSVEPKVFDQPEQRRNLIKSLLKGAALTAVPLGLSAIMNKAVAKGTANDPILDSLNSVLLYKYMEVDFYTQALKASVGPPVSTNPLIPSGAEQSAIIEIQGQELKHRNVIEDTINTYAFGKAIPTPVFDFTAGGLYPNVFSDYGTFLAIAQIMEDTGVRAFKGVLAALAGQHGMLSNILRIHTVEGRHAAHIREMRRDSPGPLVSGTVKPWITSNGSNIAGGLGMNSYDKEDNTLQSNIQIHLINGLLIIDTNAASEAFDEPLDKAVVATIISPFIV